VSAYPHGGLEERVLVEVEGREFEKV